MRRRRGGRSPIGASAAGARHHRRRGRPSAGPCPARVAPVAGRSAADAARPRARACLPVPPSGRTHGAAMLARRVRRRSVHAARAPRSAGARPCHSPSAGGRRSACVRACGRPARRPGCRAARRAGQQGRPEGRRCRRAGRPPWRARRRRGLPPPPPPPPRRPLRPLLCSPLLPPLRRRRRRGRGRHVRCRHRRRWVPGVLLARSAIVLPSRWRRWRPPQRRRRRQQQQ